MLYLHACVCVDVAKEIRLKHSAPVVATCIVDRNLRPLSETPVIKGGSDADSLAPTGGHRLIVCTQQQIKVVRVHCYVSLMFLLPVFKNCARSIAESFPWTVPQARYAS